MYEPGTVLVTLEDGVSSDVAVERISRDTGMSGLALESEGPGFVKISLPEGIEVEDALGLIESSSVVAASQPNFYYYIQEDAVESSELPATTSVDQGRNLVGVQIQEEAEPATNDPELDKQWDLGAIRAPEAWAQLMEDGKISDEPKADGAVCIAVVDEGFNADHEDLKDVIVEAYNATKEEGDPNIAVVTETSGQGGHGTHVAGIAAAQANNETGVAGVSHNAKLMLVKACDDAGVMNTETLVKAYDHIMKTADKYNTRVVNVSLGGKIPPESQSEPDKLFFKSIDAAFEKGIVTVCSAGNNTSTSEVPYYNYPSDYPTAVSVINVTKEGKRSASSNYNDPETGETTKNISAPGTSIYNTHFLASQTSEKNNSYYGTKSGSSMAAPHVAGVLALMFAATPKLTAEEAVSKLYSSAKDLQYTNGEEVAGEGWDPYTGYGEVDAFAAIESTYFIRGAVSVDSGKSIQLECSRDDGSNIWSSDDEDIATVSSDGVVYGLKPGQARINVTDGKHTAVQVVTVNEPSDISGDDPTPGDGPESGDGPDSGDDPTSDDGPESGSDSASDIVVKLAKNPMVVKGLSTTIKYSMLKKEAKTLKAVVSVTNAKGEITYEKVSGNDKIVVKKNGKVKVKKKLKPDKYKVRIRVKASGDELYAAASKTVTAVIRVK